MNNPLTSPANFFDCLVQEAKRHEPKCGLEEENTYGASRYRGATIKQKKSLHYRIQDGRESHDEPLMTMRITLPESEQRVLIWEGDCWAGCWTGDGELFSNLQLAHWMIKQVT